MSDGSVDHGDRKRMLSALVDGEVEASEVQRACAAWREAAELRDAWHAYHLIGDVMRSEDLANEVEHDSAFLAALRSRLEAEPVVLAPQPLPAAEAPVAAPVRVANGTALWRRAWAAPMAVAAGFVMVAGALVATRVAVPGMGGGAEALTVATPQNNEAAGMQTVAASSAQGFSEAQFETPAMVADGKLIRDAHLDRYLAAHKQFGGNSAVSVPGGVLRSAASVVPER